MLVQQSKCSPWNFKKGDVISLPVSIPLGAVSLAGASVSGMTMVLTSKYQKKLVKVTKLVSIVTSALSVFEKSLSKALNNGLIDERDFQVLQELHLKVINDLANVDRKMESETRTQSQKILLEEMRKTQEQEMPHDLLTLSCLLSSVLPKWISSKISTTNLIIFGKVRKLQELSKESQQSSRNGSLDKLSGKCTYLLQSMLTDLLMK